MDEKDKEVFERISKDISRIADAMPKRTSAFDKALSTFGALAGACGIVGVADIILRWLGVIK